MSLLTTIQDCCNELSLSSPTYVIGNTDQQVQQLLALANLEGQTFAQLQGSWGGWPELNTVYTFNLVPVGPFTGNTTANSDLITGLSSTVGVLVGYGVAGAGVYQSATIIAVPPTTAAGTVQMSAVASSTNTTASYNFGKISYALPGDIRSFIAATFWDRNFRWPMIGPLSPQEWESIISGIVPSGPRIQFRVVNNFMEITPLPGTSQTDQIAYEYVSNSWCTTAAGVARTASGGVCRFGADTDLYLWPENTLRLGIKYRFLQAKGLSFTAEYQDYTAARDFQLASSGGSRSLRMNAGYRGVKLIGWDNIPDGTIYGQQYG